MKQRQVHGGLFPIQKRGPKEGQFTIVFLRHGESLWNKEKRFTGWADVPLTQNGIQQSRRAGKILKHYGYEFDIAYTSYLSRTIQTFHYLAEELQQLYIPVVKTWKLNERHYGALQGLKKEEVIKKYGKQTVQKWRRSYDFPPPTLEESDTRNPITDKKYKEVPAHQLPLGESLRDTINRVMPFWQNSIVPELQRGKRILMVVHQNVLRGIIKILNKISDQGILSMISKIQLKSNSQQQFLWSIVLIQ